MDKQKLIEEKLMLVWQLNAIQEQIDEYWLPMVACDSWPFKELCNKKYYAEKRINEIKKLLDE